MTMNTENTQKHATLGNTKPASRSRKWVFTLNNYTENEYNSILHYVKHSEHTKHTILYVIGKEGKGEDQTPHLQGYIERKNPISFTTLKNLCNRLHLEKAKGSREDNYVYCSKEDDFVTNIQEPYFIRLNKLKHNFNSIPLLPWQQQIFDMFSNPPSSRSICWVYNKDGNIGKSWFCKYVALNRNDVIIASGKKNDVFNQVNTMIQEGIEPKIVILDIPRHDIEYLNYGMLEEIKNGLMYSGKYEGGRCIFNNPHLVIFSNSLPDYSKYSDDRWCVCELRHKKDKVEWVKKIHRRGFIEE